MKYIYMDFEYINDGWNKPSNKRKYNDIVQVGYYREDGETGEFLVKPHHKVTEDMTEHLGFIDGDFEGEKAIKTFNAFKKMYELSRGYTPVVYGSWDIHCLRENNIRYCGHKWNEFIGRFKAYEDENSFSLNDWAYILDIKERSVHSARLDAELLSKVFRKYKHLSDEEVVRFQKVLKYQQFKTQFGGLRKWFSSVEESDRQYDNILKFLDMIKLFNLEFPKYEDFIAYCERTENNYLLDKLR